MHWGIERLQEMFYEKKNTVHINVQTVEFLTESSLVETYKHQMLFCPALQQRNSRKHLENNVEIQGSAGNLITFCLCTARQPGFDSTIWKSPATVLSRMTLKLDSYWHLSLPVSPIHANSWARQEESVARQKYFALTLRDQETERKIKGGDPDLVTSASPGLVVLV